MDPGSSALLRHVHRNRVGWAVPVTVVDETPERVMLLRRAGTPMKAPARASIGDLFERLMRDDFDVVDTTWAHTNLIEIIPTGRWHSVWPMWSSDNWEFLCWYVNFQRPAQRSRLGWDTFDLSLDIVVRPDLSWHWKDEDHFAILESVGLMSGEEASSVRRDADEVVADVEARAFPFDRDWSTWRPDPTWQLPVLPADWSDL